MTRIPRALFAAAVIAAAAVSFVRLRGGVATDLLSLAGERADTLTDIGRGTSAALRVLCADEARAAKCKAAFDFDESVDPQSVLAYYGDHGQGLLSAKSRELLENGEFDRIRRAAKRRDYSGIGLFPKSKDPYYFISDFVASLKSMMPEGASGEGIILTAKLDGPPDARQTEGIRRLVEIARTDDGVWLSGAPFHTFIATEATKREVNAIGALSVACVLALGWLLFRSFRFVVPTLLALGSGFVAGTSAVCLLPGKPHALTFLFGTALIGLGVDYCYHSLALRDDAARGPFVRKLAGAFATTSFAFAPLAFSTVGMLRQMSVFTIAGLLAIFAFACLFLLNSGRVSAAPQTGSAAFAKPRPILMSIVIATAALGIPKLTFTTDPAAFHTPDPVMARGEAKFADMLLKGEGAFTVVEGQTLQEALEREEQMGVNGLSRIMPSLVRQKSDRALKSNVESFDGPPVYIEAIPPPLAGPASAMLVEAKDKVYLLSPYDKSTFGKAPFCFKFYPKRELKLVFLRLSSETARLLSLSMLAMAIALFALFRKRTLDYALPILSASVATLGTLCWLGETLTFFHGICFFILCGVGIDYAIFMADGRGGAERRTVLFCFLSSLAGFGFLSFTSFSIVSCMGRTIALGLAYSYLFAVIMPRRGEAKGQGRTDSGWGGQREQSAGRLRILLIWWFYRFLGKSAAKILFLPAFLFIYPFCRPAREALRQFYGVLNAERVRRGLPPLRFIGWRMVRQTLGFAWTMIDKTDACTLCKDAPKFKLSGDSGWLEGGAFLLSTHLGCIEVMPALRKAVKRAHVPSVHAFQQLGHDAVFTSIFMSKLDRSLLTLHAVEDIGVETAVEMKEAIAHGDLVLMAGDRLPAAEGRSDAASRRRSMKRDFLGVECEWPKGVFRFAKLMESPVYALTCVKTGWNSYEIRARLLDGDLTSGFVSFLEEETMRRPGQWYQFYRFFG